MTEAILSLLLNKLSRLNSCPSLCSSVHSRHSPGASQDLLEFSASCFGMGTPKEARLGQWCLSSATFVDGSTFPLLLALHFPVTDILDKELESMKSYF